MHYIKSAFALIGAFAGWIIGDINGVLITLLIFMICDYITGVIVAIINKSLSSAVGYKGLFKKVFILMLVVVGNMIDINIIGSGGAVRTAIIFFYISNEGISILENVSIIGLPLPKKLVDVLAQLKEDSD